MQSAKSLRAFCATLALGLTGLAFGTPAFAAEQQQKNSCASTLVELEEARDTLESLQTAITRAKSERAALKLRAAEIAEQLAGETTDEQKKSLRAEQRANNVARSEINTLLPPIELQATALATSVDTAERAYIACVEASM